MIRQWRLRRALRKLARWEWYLETFEWFDPPSAMSTRFKIETLRERVERLA